MATSASNFYKWASQTPGPYTPIKFQSTSRRQRHSERLARTIADNATVADQLIDIMKSLNKINGTEKQVDNLIDLTKELLNNNAKLREQVGDALRDIPT